MEPQVKENQLARIVEDSGLDKTKSQILLENFSNYFEMAASWEEKSKMLVITNESQIAEMKMADEGRKFLKQKRVEVEKTRKQLKENALREGHTIDAIAKILTNLIAPIEEDLERKAKYREIKEAERKVALKEERIKLLEPYGIETQFLDLENMPEEVFAAYITGVETKLKEKIEQERKAEEERLAAIEAEKKRQEEIRLENERLKKEAELKEKELAAERQKAEQERKRVEAEREKERQKALDEQRKKDADNQKKLDAERKEKERIQAELKAKEDAIQKEKDRIAREEKERIASEKKAARAPDKTKINSLAEAIGKIELPEVKSDEAKQIIENTRALLQKVVIYLNQKSSEL